MSLNPEPAAPEERAEHHLPPKSYAAAAEEALEPESHANGTDGTIEHTGKRLSKKLEEVKPNGIPPQSDDDRTSLEGVGQDATPRSPVVKGHRRVSSRGSHGSLRRRNDDQTQNELFEKHPDGNGDTLTSVKPPQLLELKQADRRSDLESKNTELTTGRQAGAGWSKSK
jgi:2-acylglycerol O-acyltransferase 2/2-acylglycerol O-acyltransferase 1